MADEKLIALFCQDEQRAWAVAEQLTSDDTAASVCATSDDLHELVTTTPVHAIIVDQHLKGFLTGLDILSRLSGIGHPATIVLGDLNVQETAQAEALGSTVLPTGADAGQITTAIQTALQADGSHSLLIPIAAQRIAKNADFIRPMPQLIVRIAGLINDPNASVAALAEELSTDARVTAELLKLVNSAAMGLSKKVERIQDAVSLVGIKRTVSLVVSAYFLGSALQNKHALPAGIEHRLKLRRVLTAAAASTYATMTRQTSPDMAHMLAMLQDLGILVLAHELGKPYMQIFERCCNVSQLHLVDYEQDQLGFTHADISAALLQKWELPQEIVRLAWQHHELVEPASSASPEADLLESMQFGEALADLREQTSVGRTLWFQRQVTKWGRMDAVTLRVCLMQSVGRAQELGRLFNAPAPNESELRHLVQELAAHAEVEVPGSGLAPTKARPAVASTARRAVAAVK